MIPSRNASRRTESRKQMHMTSKTWTGGRRRLHIIPGDWTWWAWTITTVLLFAGLSGHAPAYIGAMAFTAGQAAIMLVRDRSPKAFAFQIRAAYLLLLLV